MKSFKEMEKSKGHISLHGKGGADLSGFLKLDGRATRAHILSDKYIGLRSSENGWFDLEVLGQNGESILLHNALVTSHQINTAHETKFAQEAFPNLLVFNSQYLSKNHLVSKIMFSLDRMEHFFNYEQIEHQSLYGIEPEFRKALKKIRNAASKKYDWARGANDYDYNSATEIYILHRTRKAFTFKVANRTYEVWNSMRSEGLGWNYTKLSSSPTACITFSYPVKIDKAVDYLWEWRRFFSQVAFEELLPIEISARHRSAKSHYYADFYLPNLGRGDKEKTSSHSFHPGDVPFNRWSDRTKLAKLMQTWLEKNEGRQTFRVFLDQVISHRNSRTSMTDIVSLCSAIDSLKEITEPSSLTKTDIETLSKAAINAARERKIDINPQRIRGVIGNLRTSSLRLKLDFIVSNAVTSTSEADKKILIDLCLKLRQIAAHGVATTEMTFPTIAPAVQALAAACVLYDLRSTGVFDDASSTTARSSFKFAMGRIMQIRSAQPDEH